MSRITLSPTRLLAARTVSKIGDQFFDLAVVWTLASQTESLLGPSLVLALSTLFDALFALLSGMIVDRLRYRTLVWISICGSLITMLSFAACTAERPLALQLAVVFVLVNNFFNGLFARTMTVIAAAGYSTTTFIRFESTAKTLSHISLAIGLAASGFLIAITSVSTVAIINAATFLLVIPILRIYGSNSDTKDPRRQGTNHQNSTAEESRNLHLLKAWELLKTSPFLKSFVFLVFGLNLAYGFVPMLLPLSLAQTHAQGATPVGLIQTGATIGGGLGMALVALFPHKVSRVTLIGLAISGLSLALLLTPQSSILLAVAVFVLYGFGDALTQPLYSYTVTTLPEHMRGQLLGLLDILILCSSPLGMILGSWLADYHSNYAVTASTVILLAGFFFMLSRPSLRTIDLSNEPDRNS